MNHDHDHDLHRHHHHDEDHDDIKIIIIKKLNNYKLFYYSADVFTKKHWPHMAQNPNSGHTKSRKRPPKPKSNSSELNNPDCFLLNNRIHMLRVSSSLMAGMVLGHTPRSLTMCLLSCPLKTKDI